MIQLFSINFINSLQLNDIWNLSFNQFQVGLSYLFQRWHGSQSSCEIFVYSSIICTGSLLWHHAIISIHRLLVVVHKQKNVFLGLSSNIYMFISLLLTRLIPTIITFPSLFKSNVTVYSTRALRCLLAPQVSAIQNLLIVVFNMLIPSIIIFCCFIRIYRCVSKGTKKNYNQCNSFHTQKCKLKSFNC